MPDGGSFEIMETGVKPRFHGLPRPVGGRPRSLEIFNNLSGVRIVSRFAAIAPQRALGECYHHYVMKEPGNDDHIVPTAKIMHPRFQEGLHAIRAHQYAVHPNTRDMWGYLKYIRHWVDPFKYSYPANLENPSHPAIAHADDEINAFVRGQGHTSSNYGMFAGLAPEFALNPFTQRVTLQNFPDQFGAMRAMNGHVKFRQLECGPVYAWDGAEIHRSVYYTGDHAVLREGLFISYSEDKPKNCVRSATPRVK